MARQSAAWRWHGARARISQSLRRRCAHVRHDVRKRAIQWFVQYWCERRDFDLFHEGTFQFMLEQRSPPHHMCLIRIGVKPDGQRIVYGDFQFRPRVSLDINQTDDALPERPERREVDDDGADLDAMPLYDAETEEDKAIRLEYFAQLFDDLGEALANNGLLRSHEHDGTPISKRVRRLQKEHLAQRDNPLLMSPLSITRSATIYLNSRDRVWAALLRSDRSSKRIQKVLASFLSQEGFVITQRRPSLVCEMPPSELVEQCTVQCRVGFTDRARRLLQVQWKMEPRAIEYEYISKLMDSLGVKLEESGLLPHPLTLDGETLDNVTELDFEFDSQRSRHGRALQPTDDLDEAEDALPSAPALPRPSEDADAPTPHTIVMVNGGGGGDALDDNVEAIGAHESAGGMKDRMRSARERARVTKDKAVEKARATKVKAVEKAKSTKERASAKMSTAKQSLGKQRDKFAQKRRRNAAGGAGDNLVLTRIDPNASTASSDMPTNTTTSTSTVSPTASFGVSLRHLRRRDKVTVPRVLEELLSYVEENGFDSEGILRISGNRATIDELCAELDRGNPLPPCNINDAAGALKQFLRQLPDPLIPTASFKSFVSAADLEDDTARLAMVSNLIAKMVPKVEAMVLRRVVRFARRLVKHRAVNKMSAANIAMVLAPSIFSPDRSVYESSSAASMTAALMDAGGVLQDMILWPRKIFVRWTDDDEEDDAAELSDEESSEEDGEGGATAWANEEMDVGIDLGAMTASADDDEEEEEEEEEEERGAYDGDDDDGGWTANVEIARAKVQPRQRQSDRVRILWLREPGFIGSQWWENA